MVSEAHREEFDDVEIRYITYNILKHIVGADLRPLEQLVFAWIFGPLFLAVGFWCVAVTSTAFAQTERECVVESGMPCTANMNACGQSSWCGCPGYDHKYDSSAGVCIIVDMTRATGPGQPVEGLCLTKPQKPCAGDINPCGHASACSCPEDSEYNAVIGMCVHRAPPPSPPTPL
jgi:hypothetical protein